MADNRPERPPHKRRSAAAPNDTKTRSLREDASSGTPEQRNRARWVSLKCVACRRFLEAGVNLSMRYDIRGKEPVCPDRNRTIPATQSHLYGLSCPAVSMNASLQRKKNLVSPERSS